MGFQKFQSVEKADVVSEEGHRLLAADLKRVGKTSAADLSEAERRQVDLDRE